MSTLSEPHSFSRSSRKNHLESDCKEGKLVKKPKYHPFHHNPENKVIIVSSDNVKFKASHYHLVKSSQFFKDLLDLPTPEDDEVTEEAEPIPLDFESSTIALFLDLISVSQPYRPHLDLRAAIAVLNMLEYTMTDHLIRYARSSLEKSGAKEPLELLVIASDRNDVDLARSALGKITSTHIQSYIGSKSPIATTEGLNKLKEYLGRLRHTFQLEILLLAMITGEGREKRQMDLRPGILLTDNWSTIACSFNPNRFDKSPESPKDRDNSEVVEEDEIEISSDGLSEEE